MFPPVAGLAGGTPRGDRLAILENAQADFGLQQLDRPGREVPPAAAAGWSVRVVFVAGVVHGVVPNAGQRSSGQRSFVSRDLAYVKQLQTLQRP